MLIDNDVDLNELTDERLMDLLQDGNDAAFTVIYDRYHRRVKGNVINRLHAQLSADADDIVQAVFLSLHRCTERFIRDSHVSSFLLATTHRLIINHINHVHRQMRDLRRAVQQVHPTMADDRAYEKTEAAEYARHFLARLTPAEAEIVRLIDLEGHTAASAAEIIDAPLTTAQWRHRKAWKHLHLLAARESATV